MQVPASTPYTSRPHSCSLERTDCVAAGISVCESSQQNVLAQGVARGSDSELSAVRDASWPEDTMGSCFWHSLP